MEAESRAQRGRGTGRLLASHRACVLTLGPDSRDSKPGVVLGVRLGGSDWEPLVTLAGEPRELRLSPLGDKLAVIEQRSVFRTDAAGSVAHQPERLVHIVDLRTGKMELTVPGALQVVWSPDGKMLAFTTGVLDVKEGRFASQAVQVRGLQSGATETIDTGGVAAMSWPGFDGRLYLWQFPADGPSRVVRAAPGRALEETAHRGLDFSPSSRYYYRDGHVAAPSCICRTATDAPVSLDRPAAIGVGALRAMSWAPDRDSILLLQPEKRADETPDLVLYDVEHDRAARVPARGVLGWGPAGGTLLILDGSVFRLIPAPAG